MIPNFIKPFLWSYDIDALDILQDKKRIITNVLNFGTSEATNWLFKTYTKEDIKSALTNPLPGEWNNKSMAFWSLIFDITPRKITSRFETIK
ncbi:hypothetical protein HY061_00615 [Candidatus Azambacteria bacterium]|nr:hypothetical protein [Candidatus Azambacteria bacterium]